MGASHNALKSFSLSDLPHGMLAGYEQRVVKEGGRCWESQVQKQSKGNVGPWSYFRILVYPVENHARMDLLTSFCSLLPLNRRGTSTN